MPASITEKFSADFRHEARTRGEDDFAKDLVTISSAADCEVRAYVKATSSSKVTLSAAEVAAAEFAADCTCATAKKGQLCRHIWATLLKLEENQADFLEGKTTVAKAAAGPAAAAKGPSAAQAARAEEFKAKARAYGKAQREKQKERKRAHSGRTRVAAPEYPEDVQQALNYFSENGFPLENPGDEEVLKSAWKQLARIFHPDRGGTHEETLALNMNFEILRKQRF